MLVVFVGELGLVLEYTDLMGQWMMVGRQKGVVAAVEGIDIPNDYAVDIPNDFVVVNNAVVEIDVADVVLALVENSFEEKRFEQNLDALILKYYYQQNAGVGLLYLNSF